MGRIVKPHGIRGEVVVDLLTQRTDRLAPGAVLSTDRGDLTVVAASPHQSRWIVRFDDGRGGPPDRTAAEGLRGTVLRAEAAADPAGDELWVHELVGAEVVDTAGSRLGEVQAVEANPASDLLVLDSGGLVPLTFVVGRQPGRLVVDPPAGLLD